MLKLRNITKTFNGIPIIQDLNLDVETGEKIAIIGPSGCGKSTLLRLIMGLQKPDRGLVEIDGKDITRANTAEIHDVRKHIGMLFQSAALFDSLNVSENVAFPLVETLGYTNEADIKRLVSEKLELVEMPHAASKMPSELSGGQRKRIGLARAIVGNPNIVLYDEPTTGLDPVLSTSIEDLIVKLNNQFNVTSIVVTHQISTILRTADKIYLMKNGRLLPPETPESIRIAANDYGDFLTGHV
jgi:phospholipid/cholesterol/gamma-HCH transport system ATP-binding protein